MDTTIEGVQVHGPSVLGCQRHNRDILVTFTTRAAAGTGKNVDFNDFFLTKEQALDLYAQLTMRLEGLTKQEKEKRQNEA